MPAPPKTPAPRAQRVPAARGGVMMLGAWLLGSARLNGVRKKQKERRGRGPMPPGSHIFTLGY